MHAMVTLAQRYEFRPISLTPHFPVLARQLQSALDCVRPAAAEVHRRHSVRLHELDEALRQLNRPRVSCTSKDVVEGQLIQLCHDRVADLFTSKAKIGAPQPTDRVDQ